MEQLLLLTRFDSPGQTASRQELSVLSCVDVKYSPTGSTIGVGLARRGPHLVCTIADQGIGICPEDLPHIFAPRYRSNALVHKHIEGTGVGLPIVAKACDLLAIERTVTSTLGQGTVFRLGFPG